MIKRYFSTVGRFRSSSDLVLAAIVIFVLGAMIVPLPAWLLDVGLTLNLAATAGLLIAALYAQDALKLASFPTLLLLTTLFRLSLNISSTRLALAEGRAGEVIQAFGEFVIGGDYVVGLVVFLILTLVQFLVVAKGAERVAEVSARFTLDSMPGKQMSIDADLRSGAIDQQEARQRRRELERESQMFGAMDGAMKFVKGDVIAGLIIVAINLIGGTAVGVLQRGMALSEAAATYALIAIGDGIASQIPSLCITVAAGLLVTRVSASREGNSLGQEIGSQFLAHPRVLAIVAGLCLVLGLVPGMPKVPFLIVGLLSGAGAYQLRKNLQRKDNQQDDAQARGKNSEKPALTGPGPTAGIIRLSLELSEDLAGLLKTESDESLESVLIDLRETLRLDLGVVLPAIHIRTGMSSLPPSSYCLRIDDLPAVTGVSSVGCLFVAAKIEELDALGVMAQPFRHPFEATMLSQVAETSRSQLSTADIALRTPAQLIADHLLWVLKSRAAEFLGVQEVQNLLTQFEVENPALVKESTSKIPLVLMAEIFRKLLQEQISIRNIRGLLEALVNPATEGDSTAISEKCRQAMRRYISHKFAPSGALYAFLVDPSIEELLRTSPDAISSEPSQIVGIFESLKKISQQGRTILLTSPDIRRPLRKLCEGAFPEVAVLTYQELNPDLQILPLGKLAAAA